MSQQHLDDLESELHKRGWRIVKLHPGDDYRVSATWELRRRNSDACILIDFEGLGPDGDVCLPIEQSYGCTVRGSDSTSLYFRRASRSAELWRRELQELIESID